MIYIPRATIIRPWTLLSQLAISALYSIDKTDVGQNIGKHPFICRFLKGVFNEIPPTPNSLWNKFLPI